MDQHPILTTVQTQDAIVFDGTCILCNGFMKFVIRFDRKQNFKFITAQSDAGQALYIDNDLDPSDFDTFLVFRDGVLFEQSSGVLRIMTGMGWPWRLAGIGLIIPAPIRDWIYARVAKNRYRIFGQYDACMIPTPEVKARFLD